MTAPIHVDADFHSNRVALRRSLNGALENRRSYLGFFLGMLATVVVALGGLAYWLITAGYFDHY